MEAFNPNWVDDDDRWIPKGLMHDLRDNTNISDPITDNVSNYTIPQIFNALNNDITDPLLYRNRLLQQNANNQQVQVSELFQEYGY
jgi:predicted hydrolase (HD superfamily)